MQLTRTAVAAWPLPSPLAPARRDRPPCRLAPFLYFCLKNMLTSTAVRPAVYATHSAVPSTRVVHARRENGQERSPAHGLRQPHRLGAQRHHQQRHGAEEGAAGKGDFLPLGDRLGGGGCRMCSSTTPDIGSRDPLIARIFCFVCLSTAPRVLRVSLFAGFALISLIPLLAVSGCRLD